MGGKIITRIRLASAKDLVEVEAELGSIWSTFCELRGLLDSNHLYPRQEPYLKTYENTFQ